MKEITLALGGGGVKGNAHIGVLRVLEREGYRVRALAGTSAGGLWGAFYAYGLSPDEIQSRFSQLDLEMIYQRQPDDGPSWMGISGLSDLLEDTFGDCSFEDLKLQFAVTAVNIDNAEHVVLHTGRVVDAIKATIAVPGVFPPIVLDGRKLIDGGVLDPVPIGTARLMAPDLPVVAVVLSPPIEEWSGVENPRLLTSLPILARYLARLRIAQALNVFLRAIDISGAMLTEMLLEYEKPDVIIRPAVPHIGLLDFVEVDEVVKLGEEAAEKTLAELERKTNWWSVLSKRVSRRMSRKIRMPYSSDYVQQSMMDDWDKE